MPLASIKFRRILTEMMSHKLHLFSFSKPKLIKGLEEKKKHFKKKKKLEIGN